MQAMGRKKTFPSFRVEEEWEARRLFNSFIQRLQIMSADAPKYMIFTGGKRIRRETANKL